MAASLKTQLENLGDKLPTVDTAHYVLLHKSEQGPIAFLLEKSEPPGEQATLRIDSIVQPEYTCHLYANRRKRLVPKTNRSRYRFRCRRPRSDVFLPANAQCPHKSKWIEIVGDLYPKLRAHDVSAWELVLGDLLDIGSTFSSRGSCSTGRG